MKKILIIALIAAVFACGAAYAAVDQFIFNVTFSSTTTGVAQTASIQARETGSLMTSYTGTAYLSVQGGGDVIVDDTGTSMTSAFIGGSWTGTIRILRAGAAVVVEAVDSAIPSATGAAAPVNMLPGPYQKIKMTAEDMIFAPGTITGHAGTLSMHTTQTDFHVTVYACDEWHNEVVPPSATGIWLAPAFSPAYGYILTTPTSNVSVVHDLFAGSATRITFTVSIWPNPNETKPYGIIAKDASRGYENQLDIDFFSLTDYYFKTNSPVFVTAGVPFGVTVKVSHFPPPNETPDTTFTEAVRIKGINTSDAQDAVPVITNAQLTPYPTPAVAACVAGQAYFDIAYTKAGSLYILPIPAGVKPVVNYLNPSSYSPYITIGSAAPASFIFTSDADRLDQSVTTNLYVRPYDVYGNPVSGTAVAMDIVGGTNNGNFCDSYGNTLGPNLVQNTDGYGVALFKYKAPKGNYENVIFASVAPLSVSQSVTILSQLTEKFENWPNPFIPGRETTKINYSLPEDSEVQLRLFSSFGRLVWKKDIAKGEIGPGGENYGKKGGNTVIWDGKAEKGFFVGAGVYILKMSVINSEGTKVYTRKIAVVK